MLRWAILGLVIGGTTWVVIHLLKGQFRTTSHISPVTIYNCHKDRMSDGSYIAFVTLIEGRIKTLDTYRQNSDTQVYVSRGTDLNYPIGLLDGQVKIGLRTIRGVSRYGIVMWRARWVEDTGYVRQTDETRICWLDDKEYQKGLATGVFILKCYDDLPVFDIHSVNP